MTGFIIACAAMIAAALLWILLPLLRTKSADDVASRKERRISAIAIALFGGPCGCRFGRYGYGPARMGEKRRQQKYDRDEKW